MRPARRDTITGADGSPRPRSTPALAESVAELARASRADIVLNACAPRFNPGIFEGAFAAGVNYLDMAMHVSVPHPERPFSDVGVLLGEQQLAASANWEERGQLAIVGMGVEPGFSDVVARYASDHLFSRIDEIGVRDGADLVVDGYDFAPTFSIWTTIEECLNPPIVYERERGWFTTAPFSEPEVFPFPEGIGPLSCVNVEHEEVVLMPRWLDVGRVTFKYGLGQEFIDVLQTLHKLGLDGTDPVQVKGTAVSPRDVVAAVLPDPASLGKDMRGQDVCGLVGPRRRARRRGPLDLPVPRRRQRLVDARVRSSGRGLADGGDAGRGDRDARHRGVDRRGRARTGGVQRRPIPRAARRAGRRVGVGRLAGTRSRPRSN